MPSNRLATAAVLAGILTSGAALAQDDFDPQPAARLTLELVLPSDRGQNPAVNLLLGFKDQAVAMPLTGPLAASALNQLEGPDALFATDRSKWIWWGLSGVAVAAVIISKTGSNDDPAPSGTGSGP